MMTSVAHWNGGTSDGETWTDLAIFEGRIANEISSMFERKNRGCARELGIAVKFL